MPSLRLIAAERMSSAAVDRVPTLTEVVEWSAVEPEVVRRIPAPVQVPVASESGPVQELARIQLQATELSANLLFELEASVGLALEARLRQTLAPILAQAAEVMIHQAQKELSTTLRQLVDEAVTRAIERHTIL
jgi:hypothetical protein